MSPKKLVFLINVTLLLIVLVVVKKVWVEKKEAEIAKAPETVEIIQPAPATAFVNKLTILPQNDAAQGIILAKNANGDWSLQSHHNWRAQKSTVDSVLNAVAGLKGEVRSESKDVLPDFEITEDKAITLALETDGKETARILVSPKRPYGSRNFVRVAGSDRVFITPSDLLSEIGVYGTGDKVLPATFQDNQALKLDVGKVNRFEIMQDSGKPLILVKQEKPEDKSTFWVIEGDSAQIDSAKVSEFLSSAVNTYGMEALDPKGEYGFGAAPWLKFTSSAEPAEASLYLGKATDDKSGWFIKSVPGDYVYKVDNATVTSRKKDKSFFVQAPAPAPAAK